MRCLIATLAVLFLASMAWADGYVVLSGVGEQDPYHAAARRLAEQHHAKHLLALDPLAPEAVLPRLRAIQPRQVAIVLRPEQIDVNSVRRILRMTTQVDADPFVDFDFGYITGATAQDALHLVENAARAQRVEHPRRIARASVWGGAGPSRAADEVFELGVLRFPLRSLRFGAAAGKERDLAFLAAQLPSLEGCGAILMGGHGMPWEIGHGPRAEDVGARRLFPAVVFNYACYTGVTQRYPEREVHGGEFIERMRSVEAARSFALNLLHAGVTGYVAYVNPRPAGPELSTDFARVLAGESMGASRRADQAKVLLGYLGFGERGIVPPVWEDGRARPRTDVDPVRHMMLDGATGGILYGDPALRPYPVAPDALPLRTVVAREGEDLRVTLEMPAAAVPTWCADPFRRFEGAGGADGMARKLYATVTLPPDVPAPQGVWVEDALQGGRSVASMAPVWALELDQGQRILHLKANFAYGGRGDVRIRLRVSPQAAPPDFADRAVCLAHARQVGEQVLAHPALATVDAAVYDGAAGIALFLLDLAQATGEARWRTRADELLERSLATAEGPGLYTGLGGVGQVCLDAWWSTGEERYLEKARACAQRLGPPQGSDVISGAAGTGFFLLNLHAATREPRWLEQATALGNHLAQRAQREAGRARWTIADSAERVYLGFSHGAAGIGTFLLHLYEAGGQARFLELAREAEVYVRAHAQDDGHGGWQWSKMPPPAPEDVRLQWCHGSPGIGLFYLALSETLDEPAYAEGLQHCLAATLRGGRTARAGGCQCHGVSGNAELLLETRSRRMDVALLEAARTWARDLVDAGAVKTAVAGRPYGPGYMTGLAGIGHFFLRLADPVGTRLPMMVRASGSRSGGLAALVARAHEAAKDPRTNLEPLLAPLRRERAAAFEAVLALIAQGKGHWRTHLLVEATRTPGDEAALMRMAEGPQLPGYGRWTALTALGVFDTPAVRTYLLTRLGKEADPGLFMSTAKALAMLREARAHETIARRLLAFEPAWVGVQQHLLGALLQIAHADLVATLERFVRDERSRQGGPLGIAVMNVASRDPEAGRRLAQALTSSPRWALVQDPWRAQVERVARSGP